MPSLSFMVMVFVIQVLYPLADSGHASDASPPPRSNIFQLDVVFHLWEILDPPLSTGTRRVSFKGLFLSTLMVYTMTNLD